MKLKNYWDNPVYKKWIIGAFVLMVLAYFGVVSITITVGPVSLYLGSPDQGGGF